MGQGNDLLKVTPPPHQANASRGENPAKGKMLGTFFVGGSFPKRYPETLQ